MQSELLNLPDDPTLVMHKVVSVRNVDYIVLFTV
jgi:hypothetical protein